MLESGAAAPLVPRAQAPRPLRRTLGGGGRRSSEAMPDPTRGLRRARLRGAARTL